MNSINKEAKYGRGRKRDRWVDVLHLDLKSEFNRLHLVDLKCWQLTLGILELKLIKYSYNGVYGSNMIDQRSRKCHCEKIDYGSKSLLRATIVQPMNCKKAQMSPAKIIALKKQQLVISASESVICIRRLKGRRHLERRRNALHSEHG